MNSIKIFLLICISFELAFSEDREKPVAPFVAAVPTQGEWTVSEYLPGSNKSSDAGKPTRVLSYARSGDMTRRIIFDGSGQQVSEIWSSELPGWSMLVIGSLVRFSCQMSSRPCRLKKPISAIVFPGLRGSVSIPLRDQASSMARVVGSTKDLSM